MRRLDLVNAMIGAVLCAMAAVLCCSLWNESHVKFAIPIAFIGVVIAIGSKFGRAAGMLGCLVSAVLFACFLFQPLGSVAVATQKGRDSLNWLLLGGLSLSMLFASGSGRERRD